MIERESERATAEALLTGTAAGPSAFVLLGEAGIGKTTLWRWCVTRARELDFRVLSMRASESEVRLSFGGLVDLFADVDTSTLQQLPPPQTAALERALLRRTADQVAADPRAVCLGALSAIRLLAHSGPVLLAVDDAQWLDPPTASVLEYVVRRLAEESVVVLVAVRGDPDEPILPFGLPDALAAGRAVAATIRGLSREGLERLVRRDADHAWSRPLLNQLVDACAGTPFFALELAHARRTGMQDGLRWHLPPTLSQLLADRIQALPDTTFQALVYAAAMSAPTASTVEAALGDEAGLLDAEAANAVELDGGAIRFTHPLLAAAVYGLASPGLRRRTHRRLAEVVAGAEERAWHLDLATKHADPQVSEALAAAAGAAQARGAPPTAAHLWERAAAHATASDRLQRLARAGECRFFAGDAEGARGLYELAVSEAAPGPARARIRLDLALIVFYQQGSAEAVALCNRALAEAGEDPLLRAVAYLRTSWYHLNDHTERARCAWLASRELAHVPELVPPDLQALTLVSSAWYGFLAGDGHRAEDVELARRLAPPGSTTRESSMTRNALRVFPATSTRCAPGMTSRPPVSRPPNVATSPPRCSRWCCSRRSAVGSGSTRWRAHATRAVEAAEQIGQRTWHPYALYALAAAEAHLGDPAAAQAHATDGLLLAGDDTWVAVHQRAVLGFVGLSYGDAAAAARHFAAADELCVATGLADPGICDLHADHIEAVTSLGDDDRAARLLDRLDQRCTPAPRPWIEAIRHRSHAVVHLAANRLAPAEDALALAMAAHDRLPMPFARARTLIVQGRLARRRKQKLAAREALLAAQQILTGLGARRWSEHVDAELHRLGLRRRPVHHLTPTEERIARLVISGLSNREVAAAEYVTAKTVEAHLSRVYRKLAVSSRRELAGHELLRGPEN